MKHTDEQIIATVRKILGILHDPDKGFNAFRRELRNKKLSEKVLMHFVENYGIKN